MNDANWVRYNGWEYRPNCVVVITPSYCNRSGLPVFGLIRKVLVHHGSLYFLLTPMITDNFDPHFHGFEVCLPDVELTVIRGMQDIADCEPLWLLEGFSSSSLFVCPRHAI